MMESLLVLFLVALSSAAACVLGIRVLGLRAAALSQALGTALDCLGTAALFLAANVALAVGTVLLLRAVGVGFVSVYRTADVTLLGLSLLQGLVFEAWRSGQPN